MQSYPKIIEDSINSVANALRIISRYREEDITDRNNFPATFVLGRKVGKVPTGSADVATSDKLGDINWNASYIYVLIDNAGTPEWRRSALASW